MYASSDRSGEVSQNSAISSANRLTLAVARAASLGSRPTSSTWRYRVLSISSKNSSRTSRALACSASSPRREAKAEDGDQCSSASSGAAPLRSRRVDSAAVGSRPAGGRVSARASATTSAVSRRTRSIATTSLISGRSRNPRPPMTTCGKRRAARALAIGALPKLHLVARPAGPQLLGQSCLVVGDQRGGGGHDPSRASVVAPERNGQRVAKAIAKTFEARPGRSPKTVDALVVIADDKRVAAIGDELDQALLREVQVLVLVDKHVRISRAVCAADGGLLLEELHRQRQQVLEIEQPLLSASPFVRPKEADARLHQLHPLGEPRVLFVAARRRRRPRGQLFQRDELLLQTLQQLERGRHEVIWSFVAGEDGIAQLPHHLAGEDPTLGAGQDPETGRHTDQPAVRPQPAKRDRMEGPDRRRRLADEVFDALAHLGCCPVGEGHHKDRGRGCASGDQPAKAFRDHRRLARPSPGHDPYSATTDGGGSGLLDSKPHRCHGSCEGAERPIRTRTARTLRPSSRPFKRETIISESSLSWCARAGLDVVTTRVPEWSSTSSQSRAGSGPIKERNADATWVPNRRPPPGCRRSTRGRILPSLSTG